MTIDERIKLEEKAIKDMQFKEEALDGLPGYMVTKEDYEECRKSANEHQELINWLKELKAHRYAWAKLREDIRDEAEFAYADFDEYKYEVLGIDDVDDLPNDDYRYGMERALELIDIYRPKEGDEE